MSAAGEPRFEREPVPGGWRYRLSVGPAPLAFGDWLQLLAGDEAFARWYGATLAAAGPDAFFWELPALCAPVVDRQTEFVITRAPALVDATADPGPFAAQFGRRPDAPVLTFPNLGGDALLVVPAPRGPLAAYPHLASFLRLGPPDQVVLVWQETARTLRGMLDATPRWLSTSGLGVSWLHLRLDTQPKYYQFRPYKDPR